jgi:flavodoxin I
MEEKRMANIGIFYGSTTGNTQSVAEKIQADFGREAADLCPISEASVDALDAYQYLVLGTSTWGIGELQDDWLDGIKKLDRVDFSNKKVAVFGTGDPQSYPDSFVDAIGIIYEKLAEKGATVMGFWSTEGYAYDASRAEKDGRFVGLVIDEDNQSDLTDERIVRWLEGLKAAMQ